MSNIINLPLVAGWSPGEWYHVRGLVLASAIDGFGTQQWC